MKKDNKRNSDKELVSPRVKKILSNPDTSRKLVKKIREHRKNLKT